MSKIKLITRDRNRVIIGTGFIKENWVGIIEKLYKNINNKIDNSFQKYFENISKNYNFIL